MATENFLVTTFCSTPFHFFILSLSFEFDQIPLFTLLLYLSIPKSIRKKKNRHKNITGSNGIFSLTHPKYYPQKPLKNLKNTIPVPLNSALLNYHYQKPPPTTSTTSITITASLFFVRSILITFILFFDLKVRLIYSNVQLWRLRSDSDPRLGPVLQPAAGSQTPAAAFAAAAEKAAAQPEGGEARDPSRLGRVGIVQAKLGLLCLFFKR